MLKLLNKKLYMKLVPEVSSASINFSKVSVVDPVWVLVTVYVAVLIVVLVLRLIFLMESHLRFIINISCVFIGVPLVGLMTSNMGVCFYMNCLNKIM